MQRVSWRPNVTQGYYTDYTRDFLDSPDCEPFPCTPREWNSRPGNRNTAFSCLRSPDGAQRNPGCDIDWPRDAGGGARAEHTTRDRFRRACRRARVRATRGFTRATVVPNPPPSSGNG